MMRLFLVVDDAPIIRKVAERILSDLGYSVVEAENGYVALEKARRELPYAVFIDWDMGSMSGLEFLEEFNKIPGSNLCKKIYCTSEISVPNMTKAKRMGVDGFLMKPFNREIVVHKLHEMGLLENGTIAA